MPYICSSIITNLAAKVLNDVIQIKPTPKLLSHYTRIHF